MTDPKKLAPGMSNTRLALLPLIARTLAPGPAIVTCMPCRINNSPEVKVMVPTTVGAKLIVSPVRAAAAISALSEPTPLSLVLVTRSVAGTMRDSSVSTSSRRVRATGPATFRRLNIFWSCSTNDSGRRRFLDTVIYPRGAACGIARRT